VQAIGRDLHVNLIVEGSVMRFTQLRVAVRIVDIHAIVSSGSSLTTATPKNCSSYAID
jgi:TolB-like protein